MLKMIEGGFGLFLQCAEITMVMINFIVLLLHEFALFVNCHDNKELTRNFANHVLDTKKIFRLKVY